MKEIKNFYLELAKSDKFKTKLAQFVQDNGKDQEKIIEKLILPQAKKMGYNFTKQELLSYEKENMPNNLSDDDLLNIAGGKLSFASTASLAVLLLTTATAPFLGILNNVQPDQSSRVASVINSANQDVIEQKKTSNPVNFKKIPPTQLPKAEKEYKIREDGTTVASKNIVTSTVVEEGETPPPLPPRNPVVVEKEETPPAPPQRTEEEKQRHLEKFAPEVATAKKAEEQKTSKPILPFLREIEQLKNDYIDEKDKIREDGVAVAKDENEDKNGTTVAAPKSTEAPASKDNPNKHSSSLLGEIESFDKNKLRTHKSTHPDDAGKDKEENPLVKAMKKRRAIMNLDNDLEDDDSYFNKGGKNTENAKFSAGEEDKSTSDNSGVNLLDALLKVNIRNKEQNKSEQQVPSDLEEDDWENDSD